MVFDFRGKGAVVTGAGSGIGRAIALELAQHGADVWIGDIVERNGLDTVEQMKEFGGKCGFSRVDVSRYEDVRKMFAEAKSAFGGIDIVVNAAGVFCTKGFLEATPEDIKNHLDVNLLGAIYGCQIGLSIMMEQGRGGKVVNISSVGGRHGERDFPWYSLGKAGVLNVTQSAAYNGAPYDVTVNAVCPGIIRTPMWDTILAGMSARTGATDREKLFNEVVRARTPLGRVQAAEDIAHCVLFLCSPYADNITGQAINVCGGSVMS